jgi:hypothetical protein
MQYQMMIGRREDAFSVGRILGDHEWPDLGDHRGHSNQNNMRGRFSPGERIRGAVNVRIVIER